MSLNMLTETAGGFAYAGAECRRWLAGARFRDSYVRRLAGPGSMVVGLE